MITMKKISEISQFIKTGKTPSTEEIKYFNGSINWYTPGDLDKTKFLGSSVRKLSQLAIEENKATVFPKNTLLIGCIGDIGKLGITTEKCSSNQQITGIFPKDDVDINYLFYWFLANKKTLENCSNNAVVPILNNKILSTIEMPIQPLSTQKHLAAILDAADLYRQKTKNLVAKYDQLAQSLFLEMFGDPVRNEKGWEKKKLGDLTDIFSGSTPSRENEIFYIGNNPWIKTTELRGVIINDSQEKISDEALRNTSCRLYPKGTILIAMYGQGVTRGKVGILGIEAATNQACAALPPTNKINSEYLFSHLKFSYEELRELGRGGNQPNLNCGLVKSFEVLNPPLTLQTQFASRIQLIEAQKQQAQSTLQKSETLFNCLIQKAFKGELVS